MLESLFNKVAPWVHTGNFLKKENPMQMFSCKCCKILKNTYFEEYLQNTVFLYGAVAHDSETYDFTKLFYDPMNLDL